MPQASPSVKLALPEKSHASGRNGAPKLAIASKLAIALAAAACLLLTLAGLLATRREAPTFRGAQAGSAAGEEARRRAGDVYGKLPMSFEANEGQTDPRVKFLSRGDGYGLFLTAEEFVLLLGGDAKDARDATGASAAGTARVSMRLVGMNPSALSSGMRELPGRVNYLTGRDEGKRRRNVRSFAAVRYEGVYAGVDLIFYGNQRQLEYDFVLAPGADPEAIRMQFGGGDRPEVDAGGELVIRTQAGEVRQRKPFVYQEVAGGRREVAGAYKVEDDGRVGFRLGEYDASLPLTIDPVLVYSTHLGGSFTESLNGLAVDSEGNAYVTGGTYSADFPATDGAYKQNTPGIGINFARRDAFITKFNVVGNAVVYSTFLGGDSANEVGMSVVVDSGGHAYVSGVTFSATDFPITPGAPQPAWGGGTGFDISDGFVSKLNPAGSELVYSTYLGGDEADYASDIAIDAAGNAYVTGLTDSGNFPTTPGAYWGGPPPLHSLNAVVTKINAAGTAFVYSTYLGGGQQNSETGNTGPFVAVDANGIAHVAGWTYIDNFPTTPSAFQTVKGRFEEDGYYSKLSPDGGTLLYSTFLGGRQEDRVRDLALDAAGNAYVAGFTNSNDFPVTAGAFMTTFGGSWGFNSAGFLAKFGTSGQLVYSTYFATPDYSRESISAIAVNPAGETWLVGHTSSANFPVTSDAYRASANAVEDNFIARLSADGGALLYSTRFGGTRGDEINRIALDAAGGVYIAGTTASSDLPVTPGTFQTNLKPSDGLFVTKFGASPVSGHSLGGRVTDGTNPVAGIMIRLSGTLNGTQWTNADGVYSFGNLPAGGNYTVTPSSNLYDFGAQTRTFNNLSGNETADFTAVMRRFRIAGQVKDIYGNVVSGVTMNLAVGEIRNETTQTDAEGRYVFPDLPAVGSYGVTPLKANYTFAPSFRRFDNLTADVLAADFTGRLSYRISGRLVDVDSGIGIPETRVELSWSAGGATFRVSGLTSNLGNYGFINLMPGQTYTVTPISQYFTFAPASQTFDNIGASHGNVNFTGTMIPQPGVNIIGFTQPQTQLGEAGGRATFTVRRTGDTAAAASVDYRTLDTDNFTVGCADSVNNNGAAYARCDFATAVGTLSFAPGETEKTVTVPIIDDAHVEAAETFQLRLSNAVGTGATLGVHIVSTITITNDDAGVGANPVTGSIPFFVRQQYLDFLSREPEAGEPWSAVLQNCPDVNNTPACDRITVSGAFFGSPEFQLKGFYVFRFYKVAFGRLPLYAEIVSDMSSVAGATEAEVYARRAQLATAFTLRTDFHTVYSSRTNAEYVATLLGRYQLTSVTTAAPATPDATTRVTLTAEDLTNGLNAGTLTRAQVLRAIADSNQVGSAEYNSAFVAVQYYGYLRRTPEPGGYQDNLNALQRGVSPREMINAFLNSTEYKLRFGQP
jgi:hypothetical protein